MKWSEVRITLHDDVDHFEKVVKIPVMGNPAPLAEALRDGRFTVSYAITEQVEAEVLL